ncbi:WD repeat-containing protein 91 homolog isoform X1 [Selaginella moellendorffii]|uniref:WD repeat-containing protein 91 homolog isoform X1 n=1 Tax=Selaginella moellendorffii TaxID=88036 RepID=UPI000D1CBF74|nr:WD repeat-containing protein 91 homolog isoform X1 [Selaginella moellendorffii]|eukprot:XP_024540106.1 WD repeat-containing protein 91 homolog isoform X1 [Selaginella moellendorffii]
MDEHKNAEGLVREFLLFRGFTQTIRAFEADLAADVTQGYQVEKTMQLVFDVYIPRYQIEKLAELMDFLSLSLFAPGDSHCQATARKLHTGLKRFYLVHALQKGRMDRVLDFFKQYGGNLLNEGDDWQAWFALPYVKDPSSDPQFQVYFSKDWLETLMVSFRNFLCQFFDGIRFPALLKLISKRSNYREIKQQLTQSREKCSSLEAELQGKEEEIIMLKAALKNQLTTSMESSRLTDGDIDISSVEKTSDLANSSELSTSRESGSVAFEPLTAENVFLLEDFTEVTVRSQESFSGHTSPITRCRFSPTGSNIASASVDGTVRIWTYDSSVSTSRNATIYCGAEIMSLDWEHKSGRLLLLGTSEAGIKAWNVDAKRVVCDLSSNQAFPRVLDIKCSPTDPFFVSAECTNADKLGRRFGSLSVWNMKNWKAWNLLPLGEDPPVVTSICFNHNGKMVAAAGDDGVIRLFDMNGYLPITGWPAHDGCAINCVRFGTNQTSIFTMGSDGKVFEWSLHNQGQVLQSYDASKFTSADGLKLPRHEMALASHGNSLLLTSNNLYAPLINFGRGRPKALKSLEHKGPVTSVDWHPHLDTYVTGSVDHSIHVTSIG